MKKLSQERFACEADAIKALSKLSKQFKYHQIHESTVTQVKSNKKRYFRRNILSNISYSLPG
nr:hypothetical protein [Aphanizomenon flos-aquae]